MSSYSLEIIGSIAQAQKEFAKIPGMTESAAAKAALAWAKNQEKMRTEAEKTARKVAKEMDEAARDAGKSFDHMKRIGEKSLGGIVGDISDVGESLMALGPAARLAAGGMLAIGGTGAAIAGAAAAIVALERAALDSVKALTEVKSMELITEEQIDRVKEANIALDTVGLMAQKLAFDLAAELAPEVKRVSIAVADLAFKLSDLYTSIGNTKSLAEEFALFLAQTLSKAVLLPITMFAEASRVVGYFADESISALEAVIELNSKLGELPLVLKEEIAESLAVTRQLAKPFRMVADGMDAGTRAIAEYVTGLDGLDDAQTAMSGQLTRGEQLWQDVSKRIEESEETTHKMTEAEREHARELRALAREEERLAKENERAKERAHTEALRMHREALQLLEERQRAVAQLVQLADKADDDQLSTYQRQVKAVIDAYEQRVKAAQEAFGHTAKLAEDAALRDAALAAAAARQARDLADVEIAEMERVAEAEEIARQRSMALAEEQAKAEEELRKRADAAQAARDAEAASRIEAFQQRFIELLAERMQAIHQSVLDEKQASIQSLEDRLQNDKDLTQAQRRQLQERLDQERAAYSATAKAQRALSAFEILLRGAVAMAQAVAAGPPPFNAAAIAAQAALIALNTAAALAAPLPKFHSGSGRMAPDETPAIVRRGEAVLSERAVQELNRGNTGVLNQPQVQQIYWNGRLMSEVVGMALATPGPARRFVEARMPTGRGYRG